ncbi:MAG TPA: Smr/MutS family protein [Saprospiraceae bacterium]|nr:Smr/MutS family protein [Saprospiraceae bacterium]HPI05088.1 Smr/MutS family protein [Saprospiraceae bacterium]
MQFEPKDVFKKLEFDKVLDLLEKEALTPMGGEVLRHISPETDFAVIDRGLREVREFKLALEKNDRFPIEAFPDISSDLKLLDIEGYTLQAESFQGVLRVLFVTRDIFKFFSGGAKKEIYPKLYDHIRELSYDEGLAKAIAAVFDDKGEIRPDASPELMRIRKEMQQKVRELDGRFRQIIQEYRSKGWLSDTPESFRNHRRVLSVPSEHKRKIRGIIHDESDTGRTAFIEPEAVIEINNDLFDLEQDERREIFRILRDLSQTIRPYSPVLRHYLDVLVKLDVVHAKAKLALAMRAGMPILKEKPVIGIKKGYHPLLYLKNKAQGRKTIPFELRLNSENHILILSGPNAGGKSVAMKSVGLMQMMVQCGLLIPVHELSEFGIFRQIFADIGDQQSLDDDLSTYSSRLQNARVFLEKATPQTLVLIDEMGSGTDPKPGGALAEAILRQLHRKGVYAVITTHYSNLKVFAFRNPGILNGNMHFDKDTLSPTYELKVGRPGSSYAFEIAEKSGLSKDLIGYARNRTGPETAVDDILIELQREKQELEEKLRSVLDKEQSLERLIKSYDSLQHDLDVKRKRLKLDQKEFELRESSNASREVDRLIRQLKDERNLEKAQQISAQLRVERTEKARQVDDVNAEVIKLEEQNQPSASSRPLAEGDFVRLRAGGATGRIESIKGQKATVQMGGLKVHAPLRDLLPVAEPIKQVSTASNTNLQQAALFDAKVDLRGMSKDEALRVLEKFVDNALLSNASSLRILHGKGDGILRKVVRQKLREYGSNIGNVYHPEQESGGDGVTIVELV